MERKLSNKWTQEQLEIVRKLRSNSLSLSKIALDPKLLNVRPDATRNSVSRAFAILDNRTALWKAKKRKSTSREIPIPRTEESAKCEVSHCKNTKKSGSVYCANHYKIRNGF